VAAMELGALVCTAATPGCERCPVAARCAWRQAGSPAYAGPPRRAQAWSGTDRQCRGRLMALLRESRSPVHQSALDAAWPDAEQRRRCLESLLGDGLAERTGPLTYALPGP
jgi:A/G-specific adenine glycosylase